VGQLTTFQVDLSGVETRISGLDRRVDKLSDRVDKVGAFSAAFSAVAPNPRAVGNSQLSIDVGHYDGSVVVAVGYSYSFNEHFSVNAKAPIATSGKVEHAECTRFTISW
jgi:hypothetical protein